MTSKRASKTAPAQPDQQTHAAAWCDPTMCMIDDTGYGDRAHVFHGANVDLSMYNRDETGHSSTASISIRQHVSDAAPTLAIWSEAACDDHRFVGLNMTRAEFIALHAEMGRAIEATT